ncbi:MAG: tRNA glutamyl-Q(34) synthetase GluQRS [Bacteroidota bacterium]
MSAVRGRFAPSPTGLLHVGSARTALVAWLSVRSQKGTFVWRLEDLDGPRVVPGVAAEQMRDLAWLGLDWDEGPALATAGGIAFEAKGEVGPYRQSDRFGRYEAALDRLAAHGHLFPCDRSRKDLLELASAPHANEYSGGAGMPAYPKALRPAELALDWYVRYRSDPPTPRDVGSALRFRVDDAPVSFHDRVQGPLTQDVAAETGDFVLKRRDGVYAYQLAVVVDDIAMGVTEVVRGADLLDSTGRQIQLIRALGGEEPAYAHVPIVVNADGEKLSKRDDALTLAHLRDAGVEPQRLVGVLAHSLGLAETGAPVTPRALVDGFAWDRVRRDNWRLPEEFVAQLAE